MTDESKKLDELHAMAQKLIAINSVYGGTSLRQAAMQSGGYDFADTLHNIYLDYGYPAQLSFNKLWNMYRRFGVAKNVCELPVNLGWLSNPVVESNEQLTKSLEDINSRINLWKRLRGVDLRQRVGRYAGLYMRVSDGKKPSEPLDTLPGEAALVDITPLYESQLQVTQEDTDPTSSTFGQPIILQYSSAVAGNRNENVKNTINIHASRIVFAAEGADDGSIYGIPALEAIYNSLMDLRKIIGGSAEGFYKNSSQNTVFSLKDTANANSLEKILNEFNEKYDEFAQNRQRRAMWVPGMDVKTLESSLMSPKDHFDAALNDVAAGSQIPATILIGKQTGRMASEEDSRLFLTSVQSRRENYMSELVSKTLDWMIKYGVLPSAEYEIIWDDLLARSDTEKLTNTSSMATVNREQFLSGGDPVFTAEEMREAAGYEPLEIDDNPDSEEIDDDED